MKPETKKLEISQTELSVIADALQTQQKILNLQAEAGKPEARQRLNAVKRLLARLSPAEAKPARGWHLPVFAFPKLRRLNG